MVEDENLMVEDVEEWIEDDDCDWEIWGTCGEDDDDDWDWDWDDDSDGWDDEEM